MSLSLQQIRDFTRLHLDSDEEELADSLIDLFATEGTNRIARAERHWSFYALDLTISTVANVQAYELNENTPGITEEIAYLESVRGPRWSLKPRDHRQMRAAFRATSAPTSEPNYFSVYADTLYLWPIPSTAIDLSLLGQRRPDDWVANGTGAEPDLPPEFHEVVAFWCVYRAYAQQDDPEMAAFYREEFADRVSALRKDYTVGLDAQPFVLNEPPENMYDTAQGLGPLIWDWS